jgi:methylmalonic aciduria homocystinuria type C protein
VTALTALGDGAATALYAAGLDLLAPTVADARAAVLVGNTRALWGPFVAWLRASPERVERPHPLDAFVREALANALARAERPVVRCILPTEAGAPDFVGLAVAACLLWRSPGGLGVHPVYGPWVALRALVVFDAPPDAAPAPPACPPCPHCATACAPAFGALPRPASEAEFRAHWRGWAEARAACPTGAPWRYTEDQLVYHYTHDRARLRVLARDAAPEPQEPAP